ncbi:YitT family protein [Parabacteroides sp. AM08-6]|uniref:YitT family protein n=1 Tax=Parabacteroides sp. AM08-6 TaxID=2292053 RepID=UPI000EFE1785|nr:YitT family protein [Parabacteroides sp. AM08-6]RHJ86713.1 YitT family protein [Parabacteroides sp. AM08-6]
MEQQLNLASNATLKRNIVDYTLIVVGAFFQALSYVLFLAPYKIVPGGVYGISIVLHYVTKGLFPLMPDGLPMGATALCFNIPLMILAMKKIGLASGPKTVVTFLLISIFTDTLSYIFSNQPLVENDTFIACFYGGAILGIGVTCVFRAQSTSAGTDVLARVLANNSNLKVSNMIILLDSAVVLLGLIVFRDWAVPLYSWFTIFVYGKIVEMFQTENPNRAVFIVSRKTQEIKDLIVEKMGMRGTFLHGRGMYEGKEKEIIFTIAERKDLPRLKNEVKEIDPNAFISTMHASKDSPRPGI